MQQMHYRLIIEKELAAGKKKRVAYNAYCPALGLADWGETIDKAILNITKLISFHIESLVELGHRVPSDYDATTVVTSVAVPVSLSKKLAHA